MKNMSRALMLLILPIILTFVMFKINFDYVYSTLSTVNLYILIFRWITIYHIIWVICAFLSLWFYVGLIFVDGYWGYSLGALMNVAVFVPVWMMWLLFNGQLHIYDTIELPDKSYHLIETRVYANGTLYLFTCEGADCEAEKIGYISSSGYRDGEIDYNPDTNQMIVLADASYEIEEITVDLPDT